MDKVIKKVGCKKSTLYTWLILGIVLILEGLYCIYYSASMENYFGRNDDIKSLFMISGVVSIVASIVFLLRGYNTGRVSLCICEDKLYGTCGNVNFFKSIPFEISYNEIVNINLKSSLLTIEKRSETLFFYVEEAVEVKKLIEDKMSEIKS